MKLTDDAAAMIQHLVEDGDRPDSAGLRIAQREDHHALAMTLADGAEAEDVVLVEHDASVFLAPVAQVRLADQTLDARRGELGAAFFLQP